MSPSLASSVFFWLSSSWWPLPARSPALPSAASPPRSLHLLQDIGCTAQQIAAPPDARTSALDWRQKSGL